MANSFILLPRWQVALVVLRTAPTRVQQELREDNVGVSPVIAFLVVNESPESRSSDRVTVAFVVPS